jgi:hypothetical protein
MTSAKQIIDEAGGIDGLVSAEYAAKVLILPLDDPRRLLQTAIDGIERKCVPAVDVVPELLMLLEVLHVLDRLEQLVARKDAA